ncbi:alpha/beta hydrolase [Paucibacter sp. R3-3]|uniref:Alpha/beta hydrolase n=1 Tax=Roseateles agri TaxID=3098619 RepID=A0ABU5DRS2_9BURK|nr:alpha/beta hydrolase [Paucibacter sp. R3-3]MDY0749017.1 alpha/beta hydrolase [Paucibacter sp. R3-3]
MISLKPHAMRALVSFFIILLLSGLATAHETQQESASGSPLRNRTVVLVHGFFADAGCWSDVIRILQKIGVRVVAVENPLASLAGDAEATRRVIDAQQGQVVLVGHSWGGAVITQAGVNPKVSSLVFVAAFAPDQGMSVENLISGFPPAPWTATLQRDDSGNLSLSEAGYMTYFAPDLPAHQARVLAAEQGATFGETLLQPVSQAAWHVKPSWYVLAENDQMIPPELQRAMSSRMKARVVPVRSSHVVMLSHPEAVAAVILEAVLARPND